MKFHQSMVTVHIRCFHRNKMADKHIGVVYKSYRQYSSFSVEHNCIFLVHFFLFENKTLFYYDGARIEVKLYTW